VTKIGIVSAHYYGPYLPRAVAAIAELADRTDAFSVVAVANDPALLPMLRESATRFGARTFHPVVHDNQGMEFGAYQAGLDHLLKAANPDWVVFANDTFTIHTCFFRVYRDRLLAALSNRQNGNSLQAAGEVVSMARSYAIKGARSHRWLTTNLFALNRPALRALGDRVYFPEIEVLIRDSANSAEFFAPELDPAMAEHLRAWLLAQPGPNSWYGAAPLDQTTVRRLSGKARSVLQEKYIAALLEEAGTWFFDVNASGLRERISKRLQAMLFERRRAWSAVRAAGSTARRR
jgi:hypothetical protein